MDLGGKWNVLIENMVEELFGIKVVSTKYKQSTVITGLYASISFLTSFIQFSKRISFEKKLTQTEVF